MNADGLRIDWWAKQKLPTLVNNRQGQGVDKIRAANSNAITLGRSIPYQDGRVTILAELRQKTHF